MIATIEVNEPYSRTLHSYKFGIEHHSSSSSVPSNEMDREEISFNTGDSPSSAATEQQGADSPRFTIEKLSQEFAALSEEERFRLYQAKYGLAEEIHETPEFVADSLRRLEDALDDIDDVDKESYETALFINFLKIF